MPSNILGSGAPPLYRQFFPLQPCGYSAQHVPDSLTISSESDPCYSSHPLVSILDVPTGRDGPTIRPYDVGRSMQDSGESRQPRRTVHAYWGTCPCWPGKDPSSG
ncbi:hypothetical protein VTN77DRAFT_3502 [Rasamsonia byssochlamydoides]|uniref:uncharacterized protein n=1 Tax=Rasamsonia byssochlamydoides TaxID=89139 RepID=UPI00374374FE